MERFQRWNRFAPGRPIPLRYRAARRFLALLRKAFIRRLKRQKSVFLGRFPLRACNVNGLLDSFDHGGLSVDRKRPNTIGPVIGLPTRFCFQFKHGFA